MPTDSTNICRICGNSAGNLVYAAREMMFGSREEFPYFRCSACECLQICERPENMARHYPDDYYSFSGTDSGLGESGWKAALRRFLLRLHLQGGFFARLFPGVARAPGEITLWAQSAHLRLNSRILDIGCGQGHLLRRMAGWGFTSLTGVDPFTASDLSYPDGVHVFRRDLSEMTGSYDVIMLHHSFEHMADPAHTLRQVRRLLAPNGRVLIRIPLSSSMAWETYGIDWVQLDAPRHFYLHSRQSLEIAAINAGFEVRTVHYDSFAFQFWGSEQYRLGIPLFDERSYARHPEQSPFTPEQIAGFSRAAKEANVAERGDQACFILEAAN